MSNSNPSSYVVDASPRETEEQDRRARAVAAAIGIIQAKASISPAINLQHEFESLAGYADLIQKALEG
ncbi:hypothetical protein [Pseudomonas abietaniphila]